ncbi:unnamed protein product, partial [Staurois parvus]
MPVIGISLLTSGHADSSRGEPGTDDQCGPRSATSQCPPVPISATSMPQISAYQCTSMPQISANLSCLSVSPISAANQCHLSVLPISAAYQCASVPP